MSVRLPNGSTLYLATAYEAADTVSAASNANPCVLTATAHGLSNLDVFEWTSGWSRANERVFRASGVATNALNAEGLNATDTALYPAATGTGTLRKISTWQQVQQITDQQTSGGEQQFTTYEFMEDDMQKQLPTITSPMSLALTIGDDPLLAGQIAIEAAHEARALRALKLLLPGGSVIYMNGYVSFNNVPKMTKGQIMTVSANFSLASKPVRYAS